FVFQSAELNPDLVVGFLQLRAARATSLLLWWNYCYCNTWSKVVSRGQQYALYLAEASLPLLVTFQRGTQVFSSEIRPERWCSIVLAIGRLPEQEVTYTHLSRGTYDHIGIRHITCVQVRTDQLLGNGLGVTSIGNDLANSIHQFGPSTVVKANIEVQARIITS